MMKCFFRTDTAGTNSLVVPQLTSVAFNRIRGIRAALLPALFVLLFIYSLLACGCSSLGLSLGLTVKDTNLEVATVTKVVDGDTLKVELSDGSAERVRLIGIDTPESVAPVESGKINTQEGVDASIYTKSLVSVGSIVYLQKDTSETDKYGRLLRYVWLKKPTSVTDKSEVESKMLNAILVKNGVATAKSYAPDTAYDKVFKELGNK